VNGLAMLSIALVAGSGPLAPKEHLLPLGLESLEAPLQEARVGDWVSYRIVGGRGREGHWRMAVVGEELDALGRSAVWLEMEFGAEAKLAAPLLQFRMLVARDAGLVASGVSRLIVAFGFDRPQELEPSAIERVLSGRGAAEIEGGWQNGHSAPGPAGRNGHSAPRPLSPVGAEDKLTVRRGGQVRLLTAAGTVSATPIELFYRRTLVQRFWISPDVPVLHLARIELPATSHSMEATGYGHDATARVSEPSASTPKIRLERPVDETGGL